MARTFSSLLLENGRRTNVLPEIADQFEELRAQVGEHCRCDRDIAAAIDDSQKRQIATALREALRADVSITTEINENLIGGAVIRAGDVVIDGSLRARLEGLATALAR